MSSHRRALLFFHHILSKRKRLYIREHARDLAVSGICKVGFPGVLVVQGAAPSLTRYVADIKRLKWQSCTLNAVHDIAASELADFGYGVSEREEMRELKEEMKRAGWFDWWLNAMGFPKSAK